MNAADGILAQFQQRNGFHLNLLKCKLNFNFNFNYNAGLCLSNFSWNFMILRISI